MENTQIARRLEEAAWTLEEQRANPFRVQAYRRAADSIRHLNRPLKDIWREGGDDALRAIPGVGDRLAVALRTLLSIGRLPMLDRLRGEMDAVVLLASVPGIGRTVAERLYHDLGIESLEDLEAAAHDGRLKNITGLGGKKLQGIMDVLAARLSRLPATPASEQTPPPVAELLGVDREYREKAQRNALPTIAPRRFNPGHESWLPVLHTERGDREYTVMFSNTARAHGLSKTRDWVVIYCGSGRGEQQFTVITAHSGVLAGRRVVAGRQAECAAYLGLSAIPSPDRHVAA